jgi:hypothetical protein
MDSTEPMVYTFSQVTSERTLTLSGGGTIHSIHRGGGLDCIIYCSIDCKEDRECLLDWETLINETIPSEWDMTDDPQLCFKCTDPFAYGIRFKHPHCQFTRRQTSTYIMDYDLQSMRWDTLTVCPIAKWVDRTQGHFGIQSVLKTMVCSDLTENADRNRHETLYTSLSVE